MQANDTPLNELEGFRIGDFFVVFPDYNEIVKEDSKGQLYMEIDIYRINNDQSCTRLAEKEITPDIEQMINDEISKLLMSSIEGLKDSIDDESR